jgi:hypothetical protein
MLFTKAGGVLQAVSNISMISFPALFFKVRVHYRIPCYQFILRTGFYFIKSLNSSTDFNILLFFLCFLSSCRKSKKDFKFALGTPDIPPSKIIYYLLIVDDESIFLKI